MSDFQHQGQDSPSEQRTTQSRARWGLWLTNLALGLIASLFVAWRLLLFLTERVEPFQGSPLPSNITLLDEHFTSAATKAREHIQAIMAERAIPGLAVGVAVDGKPVWLEGFGFADLEQGVPARANTQFRVASVAKPFTVAAMAMEVEGGRLDLDAPVQRYVPSFPNKGHPITARQLASHRSGIRNYHDDFEAINTQHFATVTESLMKFKDDPLSFPPDTAMQYSAYGYVLLSAVIEAAAGEDFLSCMRRRVFEPLGMKNTLENDAVIRAPNQAKFYDDVTPYSTASRRVESPPNDFSAKWAPGGFLSTAEDLVKFGLAHVPAGHDGFLKPESIELLFRPRSSQAGLIGYGLGWMSARDLHLRRVHFHFGAGSGGTAVLAIFPEQRAVVALAANLGHAKFPGRRLLGIVNAFVPNSFWAHLANVAGILAIIIGLCRATRWLRKRRD